MFFLFFLFIINIFVADTFFFGHLHVNIIGVSSCKRFENSLQSRCSSYYQSIIIIIIIIYESAVALQELTT